MQSVQMKSRGESENKCMVKVEKGVSMLARAQSI